MQFGIILNNISIFINYSFNRMQSIVHVTMMQVSRVQLHAEFPWKKQNSTRRSLVATENWI